MSHLKLSPDSPLSPDVSETPQEEIEKLSQEFAELFSPSLFGSNPTRYWLKLNRDALLRHYTPAELVSQAKGRAANTGSFDQHPYIIIDPEIPTSRATVLMDSKTKKQALAFAKKAKGKGAAGLSSEDIDIDTMGTATRLLVAAVSEVGGDFRCYRRPFSDSAAKQMRNFTQLPLEAQVDLLSRLQFNDMLTMTSTLTEATSVRDDELGN